MSESKQRLIDQRKTNEIHAHSQTRFSTLPVDKSPELEMLDNKDDGVDYVSIGVFGRDDGFPTRRVGVQFSMVEF
jgi:hypothetical protein